jgi:hypothetical protein
MQETHVKGTICKQTEDLATIPSEGKKKASKMSASQSPSTTQPPATPTDPHPDAPSGNPHPDTSSPDLCPDAPSPDPLPDTPSLGPPAPAIITAVKVKPARHQKGAPKSRPGKQSWVWGTKLVFFSKRKEEWLREFEAKRSGVFYSKMAKLYIKKYGRHLNDDQDLEFDIPDPTNDAADEVVHEVLDEAEEKFRAEHLKTLRGVSEILRPHKR